MAVSADGQEAVTGSADNTVRVWDLASGRCLRVLEGHTAGVNCGATPPIAESMTKENWMVKKAALLALAG